MQLLTASLSVKKVCLHDMLTQTDRKCLKLKLFGAPQITNAQNVYFLG